MKKIIFSITSLIIIVLPSIARAVYKPMEAIPGSGKPTTFPAYVTAIYKFAVWGIGIASLLMITIGGFMYFASAGNNSKMESAKGIITDAILGLVAVLFAWIILNKINPNLVNIDMSSLSGLK